MADSEGITLAQAEMHDQVECEQVENEDVISERSPSIDSMTHPYRSMLNETSFPRCHLTRTPMGMMETYNRSMLMLGNGLPIWDPLGNISRPEKHIKSGVSIGDVGVIDKEGDFVCFFNVFLPRTDEVQWFCPPDMEPLLPAPGPEDIAIDMNYFPPGTTLVSKSVESTQLSTSPLHIDFKIKAREGGILVLPHGASREDLISTTRLSEYVQKNALSWYISRNKHPHEWLDHPNGSLYVVTGCDKAPSWAIAAAPYIFRDVGRASSIKYRGNKSPVWQEISSTRCKSTKDFDESQKYSVFIRGIKVAVSISDWTNHLLQNNPPERLPFYNVLAFPTTGFWTKFQSFNEKQNKFPEKYLSQTTEFIFQPTDILLRFMLEESPYSEVAIIEDSSLATNYQTIGDGCAREVVKFLVQILLTHDIQNKDGLAVLIRKEHDVKESVSVPSLIKNWYNTRRRRRNIVAKLCNIFPGSPVPPYDLTQS